MKWPEKLQSSGNPACTAMQHGSLCTNSTGMCQTQCKSRRVPYLCPTLDCCLCTAVRHHSCVSWICWIHVLSRMHFDTLRGRRSHLGMQLARRESAMLTCPTQPAMRDSYMLCASWQPMVSTCSSTTTSHLTTPQSPTPPRSGPYPYSSQSQFGLIVSWNIAVLQCTGHPTKQSVHVCSCTTSFAWHHA